MCVCVCVCVCMLYTYYRAFQVALLIKNHLPMPETQAQSVDQEDPLEEDMATHSSILAWRIPWTEEPSRLLSMESPSWT